MSIKILTDSGCDLPEDIIDDYGIEILPLTIIKDGKEYLDGEEIKPEELYRDMRAGGVYSTAQVSPQILLDKFTHYAENNIDTIYICFSSGLSSLYQTANFLKEEVVSKYPNFKLDIIDSKAAACGFGLIVYKAAKMAKAGAKRDEILTTINSYIGNVKHIISVEEMTYLYKGGRIGRIQALAGGLLNIKPILGMNKEGQLYYKDKARGNRKLYKTIIETMKEDSRLFDLQDQVIGLVHGDNLDSAEAIIRLIKEEINPKELIIHTLGTAVAVHTGPSIIGITYLEKDIGQS